jgi:hypothetical protein
MQTEAEWLKLFAEWESSGLAQEVFCKRNGISYWKFCQQRSGLVKRGLLKSMRSVIVKTKKSATGLKSPPFMPIQITQARQDLPRMIEIQLPHGIMLRIPADVAV